MKIAEKHDLLAAILMKDKSIRAILALQWRTFAAAKYIMAVRLQKQ